MKSYDPFKTPERDNWLSLDEAERIRLVEDFHRRARIRVPNLKAHAVAHTVVETQIAMGDAIPVARTVQRLMSEGLDRHDAIHAVGSVLVGHMNDLLSGSNVTGDPNLAYFEALERLTAEAWRRS